MYGNGVRERFYPIPQNDIIFRQVFSQIVVVECHDKQLYHTLEGFLETFLMKTEDIS